MSLYSQIKILELPEPKPRIKDMAWQNPALAKRIFFYLRNDMDLNNLKREISDLIREAVSTFNPKLLADYFGDNAFNYFLNTRELNQFTKSVKEDLDLNIFEYYTMYFISCYLPLGLYYACVKECLPEQPAKSLGY